MSGSATSSDNTDSTKKPDEDSGKSYHLVCTGPALETAQFHSQKQDLTLFGACFCPFVQRVWVTLEFLNIQYYYYEVDPYTKPADLLEVSPKGLVPAIRLDGTIPLKSLTESTVIMDYLEGVAVFSTGRSLLPKLDMYARALQRLQADHINRKLVPAFYRYLQAQEPSEQIDAGKGFTEAVEELVKLFERSVAETGPERRSQTGDKGDPCKCGLWIEGGELGWADVMAGPWLFRATNVLKHYRGFEFPPSEKFKAYLDRLFNHPVFKKTCCTEELYLDSYERYAFNRPNTSQVADAINKGKALP